MASNVATALNSDPLRLPETFGREPLKVGLESEDLGMGAAVFTALVAHYGSVKELAFALGNADPSQARAEIKAGDFRRFDKHAKPDAKAVVSEAMRVAYGRTKSPEDEADRLIATARAALDGLQQYVAHKRSA